MDIKSPGLRQLLGEYQNNPEGNWWYQKPAIIQAFVNIGADDEVFVRKFMDELENITDGKKNERR